MSEKLVTKGIVLRATATKEADYILNILTDSLGRIAVVARGARRKGSRIAAGSELWPFPSSYSISAGTGTTSTRRRQSRCSTVSGRTLSCCRSRGVFCRDDRVRHGGGRARAGDLIAAAQLALCARHAAKTAGASSRRRLQLKLLALFRATSRCSTAAPSAGTHNPKEPVSDAQQGVLLCRECAGPRRGTALAVALDAGSFAAMRHVLAFPSRSGCCAFSLSGENGKALCRGLRGVCAGAA